MATAVRAYKIDLQLAPIAQHIGIVQVERWRIATLLDARLSMEGVAVTLRYLRCGVAVVIYELIA